MQNGVKGGFLHRYIVGELWIAGWSRFPPFCQHGALGIYITPGAVWAVADGDLLIATVRYCPNWCKTARLVNTHTHTHTSTQSTSCARQGAFYTLRKLDGHARAASRTTSAQLQHDAYAQLQHDAQLQHHAYAQLAAAHVW